MSPLWLPLVLVALGTVSGAALFRGRREAATLRRLARGMRLNFAGADLIGVHGRYNSLRLIRRGHQRQARNVLYGSTDVGLVAVFRYSYDLGFGAGRTTRQAWVAVLETARPHRPWRLGKPDIWSTAPPDDPGGGPVLTADHAETLRRLSDPAIRELLERSPPGAEWETCGRVLALSVPADGRPETPERLLEVLLEAGRRLEAVSAGGPG